MTVKLNRIYQGRVVSCKDEHGNEIKNFEEILFAHHQLFQDAVNYYLFALVAMSVESDPVFGKIKQQLKEVWNDFYRNGELRLGLKHSLYRIYSKQEILDAEKGYAFTEALVLDNCSIAPEKLQDALTHVAEKCKGDDQVRNNARTYLPRICQTDWENGPGNWDFDKQHYENKIGQNRLIDALHSENPNCEIKKLLPEISAGWSGIKLNRRSPNISGQEAHKKLHEAINYFQKKYLDYQLSPADLEKLDNFHFQADQLENITFQRNNGGNVGGCKGKLYSIWLLYFFPEDISIKIAQKSFLLKDKTEADPSLCKEDPIKLARGKRGYIFKWFTELPIWHSNSAWSLFDIEAFKEALKTINQFNKKSQDRNKEKQKYQQAMEWMKGDSPLSKPPTVPDSDNVLEEDEPGNSQLPKLFTDPRWKRLNELLHHELAVQNCWTDDEVIEYGLSERTIRSFDKLKKIWDKILADERQKKTAVEIIAEKLKKALDRFQGDNTDAMGSAALFQALCKAENFCIWEDGENTGEKYRSQDILRDTVRYNSYRQKFVQLEEPVRITPADARLSRRMNNLLAISSGKEFGHKAGNVFAARIALEENGKFKAAKVAINYSAPRLRRDGIKTDDSVSFYLPPVLQALFPEQKFEQIFKSAVSLMPDWDRTGKMRLLLNFPVDLEAEELQGKFDLRFRGKNEFYFANDANCALLWPDYNYKKAPTWFESGKEFYFTAVDLGQRSAGALVRIKVSTVQEKHSVFLGNDGKHDWYALRIYSELLRLPGEDAKVLRGGKFVKEEFGKNGRLADKAESDETIEIFRLLNEDDMMLYPDGKNIIPYFPVQNDKLLIALRRAIGKLKLLDRWLWMSKSDENSAKVKSEINSAEWLKVKTLEFVENLEHDLRQLLPKVLVKIANRILPVREKTWQWVEKHTEKKISYRQLCLSDAPENKPRIRGQRGLSFARLSQLEEFRKRCQALNRILMRTPGEQPQTIAQMRELVIPDCCPDVLRRLEEMKEQRINQTANMILAQTLGVRHKEHTFSPEERLSKDVHGEYEKIPGVEISSFIVLENLSRYKFSQDRSPYENSRLMKWSHRALVGKLKMLCEAIGMPVLEVNAAYSSKFSAESIPGFRAEECDSADIDAFVRRHKNLSYKEIQLWESIREIHAEMCKYNANATSILPRDGGEIFVPFCGSDDLKQADINAAFNIGVRAVVNGKNILVNNRLSAEKKKGGWLVKRNTEFSKMIYPEGMKILYDAECKTQGGNFFVIGCLPQGLGLDEELCPHLENAPSSFLMFGGSIWHNVELQLDRCCELNRSRLKKLTDKTEGLF